MQEAFLKAYRAIGRMDPETNFRAWLCRIVRNTAIDELRRRRNVVSIDGGEFIEPISTARSTADSVTSQMLVTAALATLSEAHRSALMLVDGEQLTYQEAADFLEIPPGTVASRVGAARTAIRTYVSAANRDSQ